MMQASPFAARLLLVEDDVRVAQDLAAALESRGHVVARSLCGDPAVQALRDDVFEAVILCACQPGSAGLFVLARARALQPTVPVLVLAGDQSIDTAVEAMKLGAFDYVRKPLNLEVLTHRLMLALRHSSQDRELAELRARIESRPPGLLVGRSEAMVRVYRLIHQVGPTTTTVLVSGETGVGKELVARTIHDHSARRAKAFVPVSCSAVPETLLESELFGHVRGSFTGAIANRRGLVEQASGGTVFLDEIETLSLRMQAKLLRVLEERTIQRVGDRHDIRVDFRLIAAINADLTELLAAGKFREDLYFRLHVFPIHVPPLRERRSDIPLLAVHFRDEIASAGNLAPVDIGPTTMAQMMSYDWPGNVRELRNVIERALIVSQGMRELLIDVRGGSATGNGWLLTALAKEQWSLKQIEDQYINAVLEENAGNRNRAARVLRVDRRTLYRRLQNSKVK